MIMMPQRMTYFSLSTKEHLSQHLGTFNSPEKRHAIRSVRTCSDKFDSSTVPSTFSTDFLRFFLQDNSSNTKQPRAWDKCCPVLHLTQIHWQHYNVLSSRASVFLSPLAQRCRRFLRPVVTQAKVMPQSGITVRKTPASNTASSILRF